MDKALVATRLIHFAAAMAAFGGAAFRLYALGRDAGSPQPGAMTRFDRWNGHLLMTSALVMFVSGLAMFPITAARMADAASAAFDPKILAVVLSETAFGRAWCWHLLFAVLLMVNVAVASRRHALVMIWAALFLGSLGWVGHAAGGGGWTGFAHEVNQSVHLLAAGLWLGGLLPLGWLLARARQSGDGFEVLARQAVSPFSQMGYAAVAAIAITGTVNSLILVGSFHALLGTPYGRLLSLKILLYLAMVAIALRNRFRLAPRLARGCALATCTLYHSVLIEQAIGIGILAAVSLLGTWPPPGGHHH